MAPFAADPTSFLVEGTARYGDVWAIRPRVYVVAGSELTREVFRRTGKGFDVLEGAFAAPPVERRARQQVGGHSAMALVRGLRPAAVHEKTGMLAAEAAALATDWPLDQEVDVLPQVNRTISRMGAYYCFGPDAPALMHAEEELARLRIELTHRYLYLPSWVPSPSRMRVYRCQRRLAGRIREVIDQRLAEGRREQDLLAAAMQASQEDGMRPGNRIAYGLATLMVAAQEMPTRATGWLMMELARHPQWADRISAEAVSLPENPAETDSTHLARLRLTNAFVRETLRLHPPTWLISRSITAPTELGGFRLLPGDNILVSPYLLHHDRRYFADPDDFRPQRWLGPDNADHNPAYLPFGAGPQICRGAALATTEMILIAAMMAGRHRFSGHATTPYRLDAKGALTPAGLRLVCRQRA
ncbi:cytochrome P450 [Microtetraspora fusca]|uniref:cytochrome P450 n=1 Tax=Microtetraspora fusca TaxID=1997 RepID=UPI0014723EB5|nr:cytochrome P450 [Microtetraspora fusca]